MLDIVYCADNNYAPYVGVAILSFLNHNYDDFDRIKFHIIEYQMTSEFKDKLIQIVNNYKKCEICFYSFNINDYDCHPKQSHYHQIVYATLFLSSLIPQDVDKVLYMDLDSVVTGSFKNLIKEDITDYYVAAVEELVLPKTRKILELNDNDLIINSGLLWMNLKKLREDNIESQFVDIVNNKVLRLPDEDVINKVLHAKILKLHPCYNLFEFFYELDYENVLKCFSLNEYYNKDILEDAKENPVFCHSINFFTDDPWKNKNCILFDKFNYYALLTPFNKEDIYKTSNLPRWKKSLHYIARKLPQSLFTKFAPIYIKYFVDKDLDNFED